MYAVFEDSGSQYKVGKGDVIKVDRRDLAQGQDTLEFDRVLMIGSGAEGEGGGDEPKIGTPLLENARVSADILEEGRDEKLTVIKFKRRQNYRRKKGHRQPYLRVRVTDISG